MSEAAHPSAGENGLDSFLDKWRARWPEWAVAQVFVPVAQRPVALAWACLMQELTDAAWGGSDPRPGEAKLAWWLEELQGWSKGVRRHPLGIALQRLPGSWAALAASLPSLRDSRERPRDAEEARVSLQPFAGAVARIESELFGGPAEPATAGVTAALLQARLAHAGEAAVPLATLARAGEGALRAWGSELLHDWPGVPASRPRQVWNALARQRLRRGDAALPVPPWSALLAAWRGARGGI